MADFGRDARSSRAGEPGEILFFFVRPTDFPSAKFHAMNPFGTEF